MKKLITGAIVCVLVCSAALAQQVALPQTAADVPAPAAGNTMTKEYVQMVGRMAYLWGWPLVNAESRRAAFSKAPQPLLMGGILPIGYNRICMLTGYIDAKEEFVACPNQDVVYGFGFADLDEGPLVVQIPDFGDRFWVLALWDQRSDEFSAQGKPYGTKPGFYMVVGPNWKGETPAGISAVLRSPTPIIAMCPRVFMADTPEDKVAIQTVLNQTNIYPLAEYDGKMKIKDWSKVPKTPPVASTGGETKWVNPETFFDQLPEVMKRVPPLPGEEALYAWINRVLDAAAKDPEVKKTLVATAVAAESDLIAPFFKWQHNGRSAGNGWNSPVNNAQWGFDYLNRAGTSKSNMYENKPTETKYIFRDFDSAGEQLDGKNLYTVTFAKGQEPPVDGFWSLTLYNDKHLFTPNPLNRYSLGTKSKSFLQYNADGSLTLYFGAKSPGKEKETNWVPAPEGTFSLYIRAYWPKQEVLDGSWKPPQVEKMK